MNFSEENIKLPFVNVSNTDEQIDSISKYFMHSWVGLFNVDQSEFSKNLDFTREYCSRVLNGKVPFSLKFKQKAIKVISQMTYEMLRDGSENTKAATEVISLVLLCMAAESKFESDLVKSFLANATEEDLKKVNKKISKKIKEMSAS